MNRELTHSSKTGSNDWLIHLIHLQQAAKKQAVLEGHYQGGAVPYGYKRAYDPDQKRFVLEVNPEESSVVKRIFQGYLRVKSLGKLADQLVETGYMSRQNKPWSRAALAYLIGNEVYLGKIKYGDLKARAKHLPIIAPIIFNKAQVVKKENNKRG